MNSLFITSGVDNLSGSVKVWSVQVGIGAFVVNSKREVLVVQERLGPLKGSVSNT